MCNRRINDLVNELNNVSNAQQLSELYDEIEKEEKRQKKEELNSATNQYLRMIIQRTNLLLKESAEQNQILRDQLKDATNKEKEAREKAKQDMLWVYISTGVAFASLIATILIAIFK